MTRQNRRQFVCQAFELMLAGTAVPVLAFGDGYHQSPKVQSDSTRKLMERISISTVTFREQFKATRTSGSKSAAPEISLLTAPQYIADQLGIHNIEAWSMHFDDQSIGYCREVREATAKAGSKIVNIELDGDYNLSSPDEAERAKSIQFVKTWIDRASALGSPRLRPNAQSSQSASGPFDLKTAVDSYKQLTVYAKKAGVKILTKNFFGATQNIDTLIALIRGVNDSDCRLILDWGNTRFDSMRARLSEFQKAFAYMEMETAKGTNFDTSYQLLDYDPAPIIRATEDSGFRGIYSIELYSADNPPADPIRASRTILESLLANMQQA